MQNLRRPLILLTVAGAILAGCSATPTTTTAPATAPASAEPTSASPSPSPTDSTGSAECPSGEYRPTTFTAIGANQAEGKGTVEDAEVTFTDGRYRMEFDPDDLVEVTAGDRTERIAIDGTVRGTYAGSADDLTFALTAASGSAKYTANGETRTFTMKQIAAILAPVGKGSAVCTGEQLTLKAGTLTWEMTRES
jgi:hypothetical protein